MPESFRERWIKRRQALGLLELGKAFGDSPEREWAFLNDPMPPMSHDWYFDPPIKPKP